MAKSTERTVDKAWREIFTAHKLDQFDFDQKPFPITAKQVKQATNNREPRILCKQDTRESRPLVFQERGLFILPVKNGDYIIVKGEGYVDIPGIEQSSTTYCSKLDFELDTSKVGNSEMQHLDFAYASSLVRTFMKDDSLVLTIRGRKFTPDKGFYFRVGKQTIEAKSVQTEVDAGYEGRDKIVLIEAKSPRARNTIIRQMYYPFRQWQRHTQKQVLTLFFGKSKDTYSFWQFAFDDIQDYNSIRLMRSAKYEIK